MGLSPHIGLAEITTDDLFVMQDSDRYELQSGKLVEMTPPRGGADGYASMSVPSFISVFVIQHHLGACFASGKGIFG